MGEFECRLAYYKVKNRTNWKNIDKQINIDFTQNVCHGVDHVFMRRDQECIFFGLEEKRNSTLARQECAFIHFSNLFFINNDTEISYLKELIETIRRHGSWEIANYLMGINYKGIN